MSTKVNVLMVEDSESDAALVIRSLQKARYKIDFERVETQDQMQLALDRRPWDIIISDYKLPSFNAPAALNLLKQTAKDIPFIVVSGTIGEESAVAMMRSGAQDYLMKDKLTRLSSAVEREILAAKVRKDRRDAEANIREMLEWQEALFEGSRDAIFVSDDQSHFVAVNNAAIDLTGYSREELLTMRIPDLHENDDLGAYERFHDRIMGGEEILTESKIRRKDGQRIDTEFNNKRVLISGALYMHTTARDITERKTAEEALSYERNLLRSLMDKMPDHIYFKDLGGQFLRINKSQADMFRLSDPAQAVGKSDFDFFTVEHAQSAYDSEQEIMRTGQPLVDLEEKETWPDGRESWVSTTKVPLRDSMGRINGTFGISRDITERKRAELSLRQQATAMNTASDGMGILDSHGRYMYVNDAHARMYGFNTPEELIGRSWEDLYNEDELRRFHDTIMPSLWERGSWQGEAVGCRGDKTTFPQELSLTRLQGGGLVCVVRDTTERKRTEEALRLQSAALESAANAIVITDREGKIEWVNPAFSSLTGYTASESIGKNPRELVKSDKHVRSFYAHLWKTILAGQTWRGQLVNRRKDGSLYTEEQTITPLRGADDAISHFIAIKEDITDRKRVEDALAQSEKKFKWLFDYAPVAYHVLMPDGSITDVNVSWCQTLGYSREEVLGRSIFDFILEGERSSARASFAAKKKNVAAIRSKNERKYVAKDGTVKTFLVGDFMALDPEGKIVSVQTTMEDITERKRAAEKLRESEEKYRGIFENVQDVYYESALDGTIMELSPSIDILSKGQYHREDLIGKSMYDFYFDPEERRTLMEALQTKGRVTDFEINLRNRDGSLVSCSIAAMIRPDGQGRPEKIMGSLRNITERKKAEQNLRLSEERFRAVWDNSADGMRLTDREGMIVDVNPAFCNLVRMNRDEVLGKVLSVAYQRQGPDDDLSLYHTRFEAGETLSNLFGSAILWNGDSIDLHISSSYIETMGQERLLLSLFRDVTEQRRAEKSLEHERNLLRTIIDAIPDEIGVKDLERRFVTVNNGTVTALRTRSAEDIIGKRDEDFMPERLASVARVEEEALLREGGEAINRIGEKIDPLTGEIERSLMISKIPLKDSAGKTIGLVGVNHDITEVQRARKLLEKERTLLLTLIESMPDEICLKDTSHRFIVANSALVNALGVGSMDDLLGKTDREFLSPELANSHFAEEDAILESGQPMINLERTSFDPITGEIRKCQLTTKVPVRDTTGNMIGILVINRNITERKRAEEKVKSSEERFRVLFEYAPDAYYLSDLQGTFLDGNKAASQLTGYQRGALIGKNFFTLRLLDHESLSRASILLAQNAKGLPTGPDEFKLIRKDGSQVEVEVRTYPVTIDNEVQVLGIARDISQRKKAEEALRASEEKYRALFEESKDAVYISTVNGKLLDINPAGVELFGYKSKEEFLNIAVTDTYVDPEAKGRFDRKMEEQGFVKDYEVEFKLAGGRKITALETATAVRNETGKIVQYRGIIRDVTRQRQLETQFLQAQKMESIGTLAGGIAHDFNNILGIILGHVALLERSRQNEDQFSESVFSVNRAVERGASLVRQILTFARRAETQFEPVAINATIKELAKMLEETFPKTIAIVQKLDKTVPVISMDPTQLHQTLLNLCVNARDAMEGEGTLTLTTRLVPGRDVSLRFPKASAHHYVRISVKDTGSGMDEETRLRIFEPFFTTKEKGKGTGLGLAVVYGVLQSHNGLIDVDSVTGSGTTFHLFFPVPEGILSTDEEKRRAQEDLPRGTETILVVEDEDVLRDLLVKLLEMHGYTVIPASDGEEAVMRFSEYADEIDLVLSDMGLPKRSGWDAFRMMRKLDSGVRTVLASGYIEPGEKSEILKSGVLKFIHKPYKMEEVLTAIRETLDQKI